MKTPTSRGGIKKEKGKFDQEVSLAAIRNGDGNRSANIIKAEENIDQSYADIDENGDNDDDDEDDDDFSHYSHSIASGQSRSLPPTPEPRNSTPTMQQNRPSSKTSQMSMTSLQSGTTASSLSPKPPSERKVTSYITVIKRMVFNFIQEFANSFTFSFQHRILQSHAAN